MFENKSDDGDSTPHNWNGNENTGSIQVDGVWDGAIITFKQSLNDGKKYLPIATGIFKADEQAVLRGPACKFKATLSNVGPLTNLNCYASPG